MQIIEELRSCTKVAIYVFIMIYVMEETTSMI
jgi:hypothetical protein